VIFGPQIAHRQENAHIIVECKASTIKSADKKDGVGQLQSYMAACPNVEFGMWANGVERFCYRRLVKDGKGHRG
jgi:type I restriction enzyme M protein